MNPSQEPAQPEQQPGPPPTDPTAEPVADRAPDRAPDAPEGGHRPAMPAGGGYGPSAASGGAYGPPSYGLGTPAAPGYGSGAAGAPGYGSGAAGAPGYGSGAAGAPGYGSGAAGTPGYGSGAGAGDGPSGYGSGPDYRASGYGPGGYGPGADGELGAPAGGYGLAHPSGPEYGDGGDPAWGRRRSVRRPWRRTLLVSILTGLVIFVLGGPLGLLWAWVAPGVPVIDSGSGGIVVNDPSPEEYIAADGWFTLLGLGFGLLVAVAAWLVLRRDRGPFLLLSVVAGMLGAGYLVAPWVGEMFGRDDYQQWKETAIQGATYLAPPEVHSVGPMLVPAFVAAIVLTLLAGWSNDPDLERPGASPGYGPNNEGGWAPGVPGGTAMPGGTATPGGAVPDSHAGVAYQPNAAGPATPGPSEPPRP